MCGIAGYLYKDFERAAETGALRRMTDSLIHRGPDGEGFFTQNNVALGHRRLSIIDHATGAQPMHSSDDELVITFNGEIYNYIELRAELRHLGHHFQTQSDTEVILNSYREWGESCVQHFNGVWAFALWDKRERKLFCSRDRLGEKPLFYCEDQGAFVFASEIKALFAYGVPRVENHEMLDAYLCLTYIPAPYTFFNNIHKLPPGHNLIVRRTGVSITQYWDLPLSCDSEKRSDENGVCEEFSTLFRDAVKLRMRSDVPYGAFLSGGLDSASVVAAMSGIDANPVETFTIGFNESSFDERQLARLVSRKFSTRHNEHVVSSTDATSAIKALIAVYDEPFGDSSSLPSCIVSNLARKKVTVVLTGDGGDEALSGYTIHQGEKFSRQFNSLPSVVQKILHGSLSGARAISTPFHLQSAVRRAQEVVSAASVDFVSRLLSKQTGFKAHERAELIPNRRSRPAREFIEEALKPASHLDSFSQLNYWLTKVSLPDDMLTKTDRATMSNSLEARLPFLDHRIVELMANTSMSLKLKGYTRKYILRATIAKELPKELLSAPKRGFVVPLRDWLNNDGANTVLRSAHYAASQGLVRSPAVKRIIQSHSSGERDAANAIWSLGMLALSSTDNHVSKTNVTCEVHEQTSRTKITKQ